MEPGAAAPRVREQLTPHKSLECGSTSGLVGLGGGGTRLSLQKPEVYTVD
jgi:hypothetical protein